jgi:hypothetical protein
MSSREWLDENLLYGLGRGRACTRDSVPSPRFALRGGLDALVMPLKWQHVPARGVRDDSFGWGYHRGARHRTHRTCDLCPWSAAGPDVAGDEAGRSNQWSMRPPLRQARGGLGVATVGRQILAIAGFDEGGFLDVVEARRVAGSGRWHDLAPLPTARANLATAAVGGLVYAIGGIDDVDTTNVVETFNPGWVAGRRVFPFPNHATGPEQRPWVGCCTLPVVSSSPTGSRTRWLSMTPGRTPGDRSPRCPQFGSGSGWWRRAATCMPSAELPPSGAASFGPSLTTVERYDPKSDSWATMNPMVESRLLPCAVETKVGNRRVLVVVGGAERSADGTFLQARRTTEVFDPHTGRWILLDVLLPIGRASHDCATEADGTVLAIGGINPAGFLANVDALSIKPRDLRSH